MTEILCRWLNEDVQVAPKLNDGNLAEHFSNGYLFGEVLSKHGLQEDFTQFSKGKTSEAKLNNFMRLEPTFRLLEVPFNINLARDVMNERPGTALRILYQLFIALNRNKKQELSGQCLEFTRSPGKIKLEKVETSIFQEQLKHQTPRQVDLNFEELIEKFKERQRLYEGSIMRDRQQQAERLRSEQRENCHKALEKTREAREKQNLMYSKLKPLSPRTKTPGRVSGSPGKQSTSEGRARGTALAEETRADINWFEARLKTLPSSGAQTTHQPTTTANVHVEMVGSSGDYLGQIKRRAENMEAGRKEREKRRHRVIVQQMAALQEQEEERRKQLLVDRLMRQCQQESRIATQLMHIRRQKDTVRNNRIFRQKQFEEQRLREFQEALNKENELCKLAEKDKLAYEAHHLTLYKQHKAEEAELNYHKHYQIASSVMDQILDLATKIAEYRELTENNVPAKVVHDWKTLLISGQPLYPDAREEDRESEGESTSRLSQSTGSVTVSDKVKETLLDEADFWQYRNVQVDWVVTEAMKVDLPELHCPILTHIVYSLLDQVDPPQPPPSPPQFPKFLLRACLIGKPFSGKTTVLAQLSHQLGIVVLSPSQLVEQAVQQYLSEKPVLEAQLLSTSHDEDNPLINSTNEGDDGGNEAEGSGMIDDVFVDNAGSGANEENPAINAEGAAEPENGGIPVTTSGEEGGGEEEEEEEGEGGDGKEMTTEESSPDDDLPPYFSELSPVGALGCQAYLSLCRGDQVNDQTTVAIVVEKLRNLPNDSSWMLDNFPITLDQAKLLNSSLTGECIAKPLFSRDFLLLPEHQRKHMELQAAAGLDLVVHLATPSETVLKRAADHLGDRDSKLDQIQHRLLCFEANWPRLKRWLQKYRILSSINTCQAMEAVVGAVHSKVKDIINKTKQNEALLKIGITKSIQQLSSGSTHSLPMLKKLQAPRAPAPVHPLEKSTKGRRRRPSSAGAPPLHSVVQQGAKMATVVSSKKIHPGETDWEYCTLPVATEMAESLAGKWGETERCYMATLKAVFRRLRRERETICRYFHKRKGEFAEYLKRPDHKQELVTQWQNDFNSLPVHLRRESSMKAELHCKVDDLCDRLWDICDVRKEDWEVERGRIMSERWVEDHLGLLANTYISLMQAELVKFEEAVLLIQDYYCSLQGATPPQLPASVRVPLIELASTEPQDPPSSTSDLHPTSDQDLPPQTSNTSVKKKSSKVPLLPRKPPPVSSSDDKPGGAGGKKKDKGAVEDIIPPPPLESTAGLELDQQLVVHTYNTALTTVQNMVYPLVQSLESSIETTTAALCPPAPPPTGQPASGAQAEEEKKGGGKAAKGGKDKGGKGSPGKKQTPAKKGAPDPTPPIESPAPTLSPEERERKEQLIRAWREQKVAIQNQESSVKQRLALIKTKAVDLVTYLKSIATKMSEDMGVWIGQNYTQEVECVAELAGILRQAVEDEDPLHQELKIPGKDFYIDGSVLLFEETPPPAPPPPLETPPHSTFSVAQLHRLYNQLSVIAPEGFMHAHTFVNTLHGFTDNAYGEFLLPDNWYGFTKEQVQLVCDELYGKEADYVDWKHFLVCAAQPWPLPLPHQLLNTLGRFQVTVGKGKMANRQQYMAVRLWLEDEEMEGERGESRFNRMEKLKEFLFDLFSDNENQLDYTKMLLYLCVDPSPEQGLGKALSTVIGTEISLDEHEDLSWITIKFDDVYKVLNHGVHSRGTASHSDSHYISKEIVKDVFDRLSSGRSTNEVILSELLLDPVIVDCLDSLNCFTLPDLQAVLQPAATATTETD